MLKVAFAKEHARDIHASQALASKMWDPAGTQVCDYYHTGVCYHCTARRCQKPMAMVQMPKQRGFVASQIP